MNKMKKFQKSQYNVKFDVVFKNKINNEIIIGDVINEEEIDGKHFFVVKNGQRSYKLAKEGYSIVKHR